MTSSLFNRQEKFPFFLYGTLNLPAVCNAFATPLSRLCAAYVTAL
jgi:hypothetical protein